MRGQKRGDVHESTNPLVVDGERSEREMSDERGHEKTEADEAMQPDRGRRCHFMLKRFMTGARVSETIVPFPLVRLLPFGPFPANES